tara:strand:- start:744 stop:3287 length:2544 start_codon:yes stop_codon:yes gene_type:complete
MPYIGKSSDGFGIRERFTYLASAGDTTLSGSDSSNRTLTFNDPEYVDVFLNGVRLKNGTDFNLSTVNTVAGLTALAANDELEVIVHDIFSFADTVSSANGGTFSNNLIVKGNLSVTKDAAVLNFGADSDVSLTHVADTGLLLNGTSVIQFNDASQSIGAPSNAILDINATDEIELNATLVDVNANLDVSGTILGTTITASTAFVPDASDGAALGTTALEFSDLFLADASTIKFGADQDVSLTHVADTGLLLNSTRKIQFGDSATFIHQSADSVLTIDGEATIDLNASTAVLVSNDLKLNSDAAILGFGADNDVTLTHVADTGILLNGTSVIQFNDASQNIGAPSNAILDINATDEIEINATLCDVNANLDVSGTIVGASTLSATTITASTAFVPNASDGAALGTTALEFSDLFLADAAVISLGDDQDVTLTHVADTGILLSSTDKLMFNDASQFIQGASATVLDIAATDEIELTATLIDVVGNLVVSGDASVGDDLSLVSDAAIIKLGADGDVTLTHVADTGLLLNAASVVQFRDSAINIGSPADGDLDINADDEIELNSTLIDINGNVEISGTLAQVGVATFTARDIHSGGITIANGGQIGSVGDADAIAIASGGGVTLTQTLSAAAGTFSGILKTDDTTAATSTTDGSLQTDGGLSVAADAVIGDDLKLLSDGAIITMGANSDINLTHVHDTGITTNGEFTSTVIRARKPIKTEFNASGAVTATLTAAESGATVLIHGTQNNVINLPAAATTNPGLFYDLIVLTAVGGSTSTIVNIAGSGGNFVGSLSLAGGTAANAVFDNAGDAFTFVAGTGIGSRARITCLLDNGTNGTWQVESVADAIATID